jgi:hypothetical protein
LVAPDKLDRDALKMQVSGAKGAAAVGFTFM